ncbi:MAG: transcriptional regulator NrdR [Planctomycetaceae bacterium]|nr:transcriptional regulator NrdR [Planctomycetaceae bacterium]
MKCPYCRHDNDRVVDTRAGEEGYVVRRRRLCCECNKRYTTYERVESISVHVRKRDGARVPFDRDKLRRGLERACWKRPISDAQVSTLLAEVENEIDQLFTTEVESRFIGEIVMGLLRDLDQVAYVRFASVYLHFKDAQDFANELRPMLGKNW